MSYLDVPRIHIGGQFFTDPSTVNNDPTHYDPNCTAPSPWQEPNGEHRFQFRDCTVKSAMGSTGFVNNDTIIGATIAGTDEPDIARLVDLDVYQQGVPTIFGMKVQISFADGTFIKGDMDPATLNGLWFNAVLPTRSWGGDYGEDSYGGDMNACGYFISVLRIDPKNWTNTSSVILQQLRAATITVDGKLLMSFKFIMDGYENVPQNANFRLGRITGTLGPVKANEPLYNSGQRWMQPRAFATTDPWNYPSFNPCVYKVDAARKKLIIDMANSICRQSAGGDPVDLGTLSAIINCDGQPSVNIGQVDYSGFAYSNNAQITELNLTDAQLNLLSKGGLSLQTSRTDIGDPVVLKDNYALNDFAVEIRPIRMEGDPGTIATTTVYVSHQGVPVANKQLALAIESVHGTTPGATVPPTNPGNTPQADGTLQATISPTDQYGFATVTLKVLKDPGQRTPELDGQLYFVIVYDPLNPDPYWLKNAPVQENLISVVAYSQYTVNTNPTWEEMQAMMAPYMKLYPSMKAHVDLTDLHTVTIFSKNPPWAPVYHDPIPGPLGINAGAIPFYMSRDFNDPRFMPISRDLSASKTLTYMHFVKNLQAQP